MSKQDPRMAFLGIRIAAAKQKIKRTGKTKGAWGVQNHAYKVTLTKEEAFAIGERQGWRCALTGDKLEFTSGGKIFMGKWSNPRVCTMDRKDPTDDYSKRNVQLVTWEANHLKSGFTSRELKALCRKIVDA